MKILKFLFFWLLLHAQVSSTCEDMSDPDTGNWLQCAAEEITLTAADIPGAELPEPFEKHTVYRDF